MRQALAPITLAAALAGFPFSALAQPYDLTIRTAAPGGSSMSSTFNGTATFSGTFIGNYDQATNPAGTRTLNYSIVGTRPAAPTNIAKTLSGNGSASGNAPGVPTGSYQIEIGNASVVLRGLTTNLIGAAAQTPAPVNATITYQSFLTAAPNYSYPFLIPIPVSVGTATVTSIHITQTADATGPITGIDGLTQHFSVDVPVDVTATVDFQGSPLTQTVAQTLTVTGSITPTATGESAVAGLSFTTSVTNSDNTPQPQPTVPFDFPPPPGSTGTDPAQLLLTLTINSQSTTVNADATLPASGPRGSNCGSGDFNGDGDFGTDQDIEAFFACLAGACCPTCGNPDFNGDGDTGTDQDIEAFFRVLTGAPC